MGIKRIYQDNLDVAGAAPLYDYNFSVSGERDQWGESYYKRFVKTQPDNMDDVMVEALSLPDADRELAEGNLEYQDMLYPEREDIYNTMTFRAFNKSKTI